MAGHSKWANIKHKKGAADAKRGKVFTMHAKLITIAAKSGGDPAMNPALRSAIDRAKADNVPNANIERAIKKGTGEDKDAAVYEELTYEAMGPGGTSFMVDVVTDNTNRSLSNIRTIITKSGGSMGSVAWKFDKKAYFLVELGDRDPEEAQLELIDCGADDFADAEEGKMEVYTEPSQFGNVKKAMEAAGYKIEKDELVWKPKNELPIGEKDVAEKVLRLMDRLDDDEDVNQVYTDADIASDILASL